MCLNKRRAQLPEHDEALATVSVDVRQVYVLRGSSSSGIRFCKQILFVNPKYFPFDLNLLMCCKIVIGKR